MVLLFFDIGASELMLILLVIVIFFGADKIPEMARGLGKGMRQFRDATGSIQREIEKSIEEKDAEARRAQQPAPPQIKPPEHSVTQKPADGDVPPLPEEKQEQKPDEKNNKQE